MPDEMREVLRHGLGVGDDETYEVRGMLDLTSLVAARRARSAGPSKPRRGRPVVPPRFLPLDEDEPADVFAAIRAGDVLVHHPYESFTASVERLVEQAADDPDVLTIKQTLYRTSLDSRVVHHLIRAAEHGKQVVVLVEIKARFDEEANIDWARKLEQAGRPRRVRPDRPEDALQDAARRPARGQRAAPLRPHRHRQLQHPDGSRTYVDLGLFTCRPEIGEDVSDLFNILTGLSRQRTFRRLIVAPTGLRERFLAARRARDRARRRRPPVRNRAEDERPHRSRPASRRSTGRRRRASTST